MTDSSENFETPEETTDAEIVENEIVDAEVVEDPPAELVEAEIVEPKTSEAKTFEPAPVTTPPPTKSPPVSTGGELPLDLNVQRLSAKAGAVGSVLLATLGLVGMLLSPYSIINVMLAFVFASWGMNSPLRSTAMVGGTLAIAGVVAFFTMHVSQF